MNVPKIMTNLVGWALPTDSSWCGGQCPPYCCIALFLCITAWSSQPLFAQQEPAESTETSELPKLIDMKTPSAEDLVKKPPVDWIVLNGGDERVIVAEPVYPRPKTLETLTQRIADSKNWPRPTNEQEVVKQRERRLQLNSIELVLPGGGAAEAPEYQLETFRVNRIIYHEDLILRRIALLRDQEKYRDAFEMLFTLSRKHPQWPGLDAEQNHLIFAEAITQLNTGRATAALVFLEQLHERQADYPGLKTRLGDVVDRLISDAHKAEDYRKARYFLGRLAALLPNHEVSAKWTESLRAESTVFLNAARQSSGNAQHDLAVISVEKAASIWPRTSGLQAAHSRFTNRFQKLKVGVLRLPGDKTAYPLPAVAEMREKRLTQNNVFEYSHIDEIPLYRSRLFEQWEPVDLGRQTIFTLRQNRSYWESQPLVTALSIAQTLSTRIDPSRKDYDERLDSFIESVTVESPFQIRVKFSRVPLRTETMFHYPVVERQEVPSESNTARASNISEKLSVVSRSFQRHERDEKHVSYRRNLAEPEAVPQYHVAEVIEMKYNSHKSALQGLVRGEIDMLPHLQPWDVDTFSRDDRFYVQQYALPFTHVLQFNPKNKALRNRELRRALAYALDRPGILKRTVLRSPVMKHGRLTTAPFPSDSYAYNLLVTPLPFDLTQAFTLSIAAKNQLEDKKLPVLKLLCVPDPIARAAAVQLVNHWARIGVTVQLVTGSTQSDDWDILYRMVKMTEPFSELWPFLTLESQARVESLMHLPDWFNRELIALDSAPNWISATDSLKRLHRMLMDEVQIIPLWEVDDFMVLRKNITGVPKRPMHTYQSIELWRVNSWYPKDAR
jgi:ABC-type transport system substrate-binding protein